MFDDTLANVVKSLYVTDCVAIVMMLGVCDSVDADSLDIEAATIDSLDAIFTELMLDSAMIDFILDSSDVAPSLDVTVGVAVVKLIVDLMTSVDSVGMLTILDV